MFSYFFNQKVTDTSHLQDGVGKTSSKEKAHNKEEQKAIRRCSMLKLLGLCQMGNSVARNASPVKH